MFKKKILYIDYLDYFSLAIGLLLWPFFKKVHFHNAIKRFQSEKARLRLRKYGIHWLSYLNVPMSVYVESFNLNFDLEEKLLKNTLSKTSLYKHIITYFKLDEIAQRKMDAALRRDFQEDCIFEGTSSISLIRYVYSSDSQLKVYYLPHSLYNFYLLNELKDERIVLLVFHSIVSLILSVLNYIYILIYGYAKGIVLQTAKLASSIITDSSVHPIPWKKVSKATQDPSNCEIGFFPHSNLYYSDFFKKTYLYEDNPQSIFHKDKVLTLFHGGTDPLSKRYLEIFNIPYADFNALGDRKAFIKSVLLFFRCIKNNGLFLEVISIKMFLLNIILAIFAIRLILSLNRLNMLRSLKIIYVHYDSLFSQVLVLACYIRSIQTISMQERSYQHIFMGNLCYDHYLINGPGFVKELEKRHYDCQKYPIIGLPRSAYIKTPPKNLHRYARYMELKKKYFLVVCYGYFPVDDFAVGINGDCGILSASVLNFLETIKQLADHFPEAYFVVRFKETAFLSGPLYEKLVNEIATVNNIEITMNLKKYNSYAMAHLADLIIGKQTSIMEEALSVGKKVLFYDNEEWLKPTRYIVNSLNIVESNITGLKKRINDILYQGIYLSADQESLMKTYFADAENKKGFAGIKDYIEGIKRTS